MLKNHIGSEMEKIFKKGNQSKYTAEKRHGRTFERYQKTDHVNDLNNVDQKGKKFFDKKTYRMKKYSNKYKLDKWEDNRRKSVLKKYYKDLKNDPQYGNYKPFNFDNVESNSSEDEKEPHDENNKATLTSISLEVKKDADEEEIKYVIHPDAMEKFRKKQKSINHPFKKAQQEMNRLREKKINQKAAVIKAKEERAEALAKYKLKKTEKFKKLSKKTRKGQPLMKDRMQILLENIQKSVL